MKKTREKAREYTLVALRVALGWIFLWSFLDKLLGLGFSTSRENAWIAGGSPTAGFLEFGVSGPLVSIFQSMSGSLAVDILFMAGMFLVGISLILGLATKIGAYAGSLMMLLIYISMIPPQNNPIVDEHIIYIIALILISFTKDRFRLDNKLGW